MASALADLRAAGTAVYLPSLLYGIAQGATVPLVALTARDLDAPVATAAIVVGLVGIGKILGDVPAGWLAGRFGERRAMLVATGVFVLGSIACLVAWVLPVLMVGAAAIGAATAVFAVARQLYVTEQMPYEVRGRAMSTLGGTQRIGLFAGPALGAAVMSVLGTSGGYWLAVAMALLAALVLALTPDPDGPPARAAKAPPHRTLALVREHFPVLRTVGFGILLLGAVRASRQAAIPLWGDHIGLDPATTSLIFSLSGAMEMVFFYPAGMVMDRFGRGWVVVPSTLVLALSLALLPLSSGVTGLAVFAGLIGLGNGLGSGINMTLGADASPAEGRAAFLGVWRLFGDLGNGAGPLLVGAVATVATLGAGIVAAGVAGGVSAVILARSLSRRRPA